jgi:hypothetical protein
VSGSWVGGYPYDVQDIIDYAPSPPTHLFSELLEHPDFIHLGRVYVPCVRGKYPSDAVVNRILLPYVIYNIGDFLDPDRVGVLRSKYALATKYPRAEYTSIKRYCGVDVVPDLVYWRVAMNMLSNTFDCMSNSKTLDLNGAKEVLEKSSSPGYPWNLVYKNKRFLFGNDSFDHFYAEFISDLRNGVPRYPLYKSFIKVEFKKVEDLIAHNPRTITSCPVEVALLGAQLFTDMNGKLAMAGANFEVPCWIGVTKFARNWHKLALYLLALRHLFHGDVTRWDGSVRKFFLWCIRDLRKTWLNAIEDLCLIDFYYSTVIFTLIVTMLGDLLKKHGGQPSGQTNTLSDNTLLHVALWFYHWVLYSGQHGFDCTWSCFREHVHLMVMGDDVIWSCDDDVLEFMRPSVVADTFKKLGFILKHSGDTSCSIFEAEFCSMHFMLYGDVYVPRMRFEKLMLSLIAKPCTNHRVLLKRCLALRVEGWWDLRFRNLVDDCVEGLLRDYQFELRRSPTMVDGDDQDYEQLLAVKWPAWVIESQYLTPQI